ncbi:uncharacterized protein VP01_1225g12 [Puccinia sorghi]|uniref:Uncharacterized protein n=1 Tax=Puccinia sorghi TaxID=27349 RepID=A0A0L6VPX7_9BASI|nr:uncharacterized protein VP01_1225g12 [Puccinia sorghi]
MEDRPKLTSQSKGLTKYILKLPVPLVGVAAEAVNKKHAETVDILINYMSKMAFKAVITHDKEENPYEIWNTVILRFASTSVKNKGLFRLKFMWYKYKGSLKEFIANMHKMLTFSILAKLSEDLYNMVDNIIFINKVIVESPKSRKTKSTGTSKTSEKNSKDQTDSVAALIQELKKGKKKGKRGPYCAPGKHNLEATSHNAENCW